MNSASARHDFTMDPNLLMSVIKSQAGTLSKAIVEGVANSIDAGATKVEITLTPECFTVRDNGRGFHSEEEIRNWFGRFGTAHAEGDAVFGRFRMGRGQMMAFAKTTWSSGLFCMKVDIEANGLSYELDHLDKPVRGCVIEGVLYQPLSDYKLTDVLSELKQFVAFSPRPVYVNGELYGAPAGRLKTWSFEDDHAYYRVSQEAKELQIYNQGLFVEQIGSWRTGMGGVIVSKQPLTVNFARNSILEDRCPVWKHITFVIERTVLSKLSGARKLSDAERRFLARHLARLREVSGYGFRQAKLLTDPTGKHVPLEELAAYRQFVHIPEASPRACALHGRNGTFVVTGELLERFGADTLEDFIARIRRVDASLVAPEYEIVKDEELGALELGRASLIETSGLTRRQVAAYRALCELNAHLGARLAQLGVILKDRELRVGEHEGNRFVAWTDGARYITANRKFLKLFERGLDGILEWLHTLVHEYTHDTDDSESHSHGEVFYRKFHDTLFMQSLGLASLAQEGLKEYLKELYLCGLPRPRRLSKQLSSSARFDRRLRSGMRSVGSTPSSVIEMEHPVLRAQVEAS